MSIRPAGEYLTDFFDRGDIRDMAGFVRQIPRDMGEFDVREQRTRCGMGFFSWHMEFHKDVQVEKQARFARDEVQFLFFPEQGMEGGLKDGKEAVAVEPGEMCMYLDSGRTTVGTYEKDKSIDCQSLQIPAARFRELVSAYFDAREEEKILRLCRKITKTGISPRTAGLIRELQKLSGHEGGTAGILLEGKFLELISFCLEEFTDIRKPEPDIARTDREAILEVRRRIDRNCVDHCSLEELAHEAGLSVSSLSRGFARETGISLHAYVIRQRLSRAAVLLETGEVSVSQAAVASGYTNMSHFSASFKKQYGVLPRDYGK